MPENKKSPDHSVDEKRITKDCRFIQCPRADVRKNFIRDPSGFYVLIRINFELAMIELAVADRKHNIVAVFSGCRAQDIYYSLFQHEKKNKKNWFNEKTHIAYIGKELKKAELALVTGNSAYYQE